MKPLFLSFLPYCNRPNVAIHDLGTICSDQQAGLAKNDSVTKPKQCNRDASALRGWRHGLVRGVLVEWDVHHDSVFSLGGLMHHVGQEENGALRDMWNTRGAVVSISTEKVSTSTSDHGVQLGILSHSRDPWRGCVEALFLRISRKCNGKYSCSLPKPRCISHANGASFLGDTAPS